MYLAFLPFLSSCVERETATLARETEETKGATERPYQAHRVSYFACELGDDPPYRHWRILYTTGPQACTKIFLLLGRGVHIHPIGGLNEPSSLCKCMHLTPRTNFGERPFAPREHEKISNTSNCHQ